MFYFPASSHSLNPSFDAKIREIFSSHRAIYFSSNCPVFPRHRQPLVPRGLNSRIRISIGPPPDVAGILPRVNLQITSITLRLHLMTADRHSDPATILLPWRLLVRIADSQGQLLGHTTATPNGRRGCYVLIVTERAVHSTSPPPADRRLTARPSETNQEPVRPSPSRTRLWPRQVEAPS